MKHSYAFYIVFLSVFIFSTFSRASDIVNVQALNSHIIIIHFDDGFVRYHQRGEARQNEWVVAEPLDIGKATNPSNYKIKSFDGFYANPVNPFKVSRKSKGTEFTWLCQNYNSVTGCVNTKPDHVKEHWIYLYLSEPLETGKKYWVSTGDVAGNGNEWELDFSLSENLSEAIHVNIVGYDPRAPQKYGYVYHWAGESGSIDFSVYNGNNFYLIDAGTEKIVFTGKIKFRKDRKNKETFQTADTPDQNFLGADVYECDFSEFEVPGEYFLAVEGIGRSFIFKIKNDIYRLPFYTSVRGLYHNRSGIDLKQPYTEFTRPAPHNPLKTPGFSGKLKYTTSRFIDWNDLDHSTADKQAIEAGILGPADTWGWYQDAGDWDGYFTHMKIPAMLMLTWEIAPEKFADGELNLPEGVNQIPDILDEAGWLIRFFYRTRHELINKGYGSGGIGSRVAPDWFGNAPDGVPSYLDNGQWIISGEDPFTTFFYAGLAGHYALVLDKLGVADPEGTNWKNEAEEAFQWAKNNTKPNDNDPLKVHNYNLKDFELYAASSLFRITGSSVYSQIIKKYLATLTSTTILSEDKKWGTYTLITGKEHIIDDSLLILKVKGAVIATADQEFSSIAQRACRYGGNMWMPMLVGQGTTPQVFGMMMGHFLSKEFAPSKTESYLAGLYTTADYFLGCNPLNMAYITHVGVRYPERVMHLDSWYRDGGEMVPGITPYGPWKDDGATPATGPWDLHWPYKTLYPESINKWPGHERWFNNYTTPLNAEFTVHQNTVLSAVVYGYLCDVPDGSFHPNKRPAIEISSPAQNSEIKGDITISTDVIDPNGENDIAWVEFYNDWHKIGQTNKAPFQFAWKKPVYGRVKLSAKVVDKSGFSSKSEAVEINVLPLNYNVSVIAKDSLTNQIIPDCEVIADGKKLMTDNKGEAKFEQIPGLFDLHFNHEKYISKDVAPISIYNDTALVFYLVQKKNEVLIVIHDNYTGDLIEGAQVDLNYNQIITNKNGEAFYKNYSGNFEYTVTKNSFREEKGIFEVNSDTTFHVFLVRTEADVKFELKDGIAPVTNAVVVFGTDTLLSSVLGIARFKEMPVSQSYDFMIYKTGYDDVFGKLFLMTDSTISVTLNAYPVGIKDFGENAGLKIWPNPVHSGLTIISDEIVQEIIVYSLTGKLVVRKTGIQKKTFKLDFLQLEQGIYLLEIRFTNGQSTVRNIVRN